VLTGAPSTPTAPVDPAPQPPASLDTESQAWIERLSTEGPQRDAAIAELHALLLKAARHEVRRRRAAFCSRPA
jgi:RNA polymerase sigma-70 factor, ECF subfamily